MNGFTKHGIDHSSPSSINMWASAPCAWVAKYLLDKKMSFSLAAKAGTIVEAAIVEALSGVAVDLVIERAQADYNRASAFGASDADRKRGEAIPGMIEQAYEFLAPFGDPDFGTDVIYGKKQKKIEMRCNGDGWQLPVIGYLDFYYPQHGLIVDLKTSMRLPSELPDEHYRQGAMYRGAMGNCGVKFLYVTGKGYKVHEIEDHVPILAEIKTILNRQEKFLALGDAEKLKQVVPVQAGSFYWNGDQDLRREIYGI